MKFSDIREGIQQAWQFLLPPFVSLFVLVSLTYYIGPHIFATVFTKATLVNFSFVRDESFQKFLEFYGISKLAPLFLIIGLIFILYVIEATVRNVGHLLPGYIVDFGERRLMHVLNLQPSKFAELWARFPDTPDAFRLVVMLQRSLVGVDDKAGANIAHWQNQFGKYYRTASALKFYVLWSFMLVMVLVIMRQPIGVSLFRFVSVTIIVAVILLVLWIKQIYSLEQKAFAELTAIESILYRDDKIARYPDVELVSKMQNRVWEFQKKDKDVWWELRFFDTHQYQWFYRTFLKRKAA